MPISQKKSKVIVKGANGLVQIIPETTIEAVEGLSSELQGVVHNTGAESVDGVKTFAKNTMTTAVALTGSAIDVSSGSFFTKTISADTTFTFTNCPTGKTCVFTLVLTNGGAYEVTFPVNVTWAGGNAPELKTVGVDCLTFFTVDGGTSWLEVSGGGGASGGGTISDSGVVAGSYGPSANASPEYGETFTVPQITVNQKGQVTNAVNKTITVPSSDNTDVKVALVENSWQKAYLMGADASAYTISGSPVSVTATADAAVYLGSSPGNLHATTFNGALNGNASSATKATQDGDGNVIKTTYATLASPALTGTPTAPTATAGTNTTQIATTAFVANALSGYSTAKEVGYATVEPTTSSVASLDNESVIFFEDTSAPGTPNGVIVYPSVYVGATANAAGTAGLVPAAAASDTDKFLQGDGTWTSGVHLAGNETISGQKVFAQGPYGTTAAISASEINLANGTVFTKTISANTTFTITGAPSGKAASFSLVLTNGGAYTITWPSSVKWAGGNVPTLTASGVDLLTFLTPDGGTTWYGVLSAKGAA